MWPFSWLWDWLFGDARNFKKRMEALQTPMKAEQKSILGFARQWEGDMQACRLAARNYLGEGDEVGARSAVHDALNYKFLREKAMKRYNWLSDKTTQMEGMFMSRVNVHNDKYYSKGMRKLARNEDPDRLERQIDDIEAGFEDFEAMADEIAQILDTPLDTRTFAIVQEDEIVKALDEWYGWVPQSEARLVIPPREAAAPRTRVAQPVAIPSYAAPVLRESDANDDNDDAPPPDAGFEDLLLAPVAPAREMAEDDDDEGEEGTALLVQVLSDDVM